jgi:hypothetical protein
MQPEQQITKTKNLQELADDVLLLPLTHFHAIIHVITSSQLLFTLSGYHHCLLVALFINLIFTHSWVPGQG